MELDGRTFAELIAEPEEIEPTLPGASALWRDVRLVAVEEGLELQARWEVEAIEPGWLHGVLLGPGAHVTEVTWNGAPAAAATLAEGTVLAGWVDEPVTVTLTAFLPGDPSRAAMALRLLPAVRGEISLASAAVPLEVREIAGGGAVVPAEAAWSTGTERVEIGAAPAERRARGTLAVARTGLGLTVGDAEVRGKAHLQWEVRSGELERVSFAASGLGADLDVTGPNVRTWARVGERIEVELQSPVRDRLDIEVRWSAAVPAGTEGSLPMPRIAPLNTFRTETAIQLARDGDVEVVPELAGWEAVAAASLPEWASGLIEGTPTAAYLTRGAVSGSLGLFRFEPVAGPPVVVDIAQLTVAATAEGRTLTRAHYEVRNERASHLRIVPPAGSRILGVRVGTETSLPVTDGRGGWLIPLARSVETVEGLLSFPVEVALLGETVPWGRREERELGLPSVDAPVAVSRVTLYLPPDFTSLLDEGEDGRVVAFSEGEGITYGFGVGDVGATRADELFQEAVASWMANDFDEAQGYLDELTAMGAESPNIYRLQSNIDVVEGRYDGDAGDVTMERRVKEQARARASDKERKQVELEQAAEELLLAGDYEEAERYYESALELGETLQQLEQSESVEVETRNIAVQEKLADARGKKEKKKAEEEQDRTTVSKSGGRSSGALFGGRASAPLPAMPPPDESVASGGEDLDGFDGEYWKDDLADQKAEWIPDDGNELPPIQTLGDVGGGGAGAVGYGSGAGSFGEAAGPGDVAASDFRWSDEETGKLADPGPYQFQLPSGEDVLVEEGEEESGWGGREFSSTLVGGVEGGVVGGVVGGVLGGASGGVFGGVAANAESNQIPPVEAPAVTDPYPVAQPAPKPAPRPEPSPEPEPDYDFAEVHTTSSESIAVDRRGPSLRIRLPKLGKPSKDAAPPPPPPEPYADEPVIASGRDAGVTTPDGATTGVDFSDALIDGRLGGDWDEDGEPDIDDRSREVSLELLPEPVVTASALSVTVPAAGEAVRYQQLLVPADAPQTVRIHAKNIPPKRRR